MTRVRYVLERVSALIAVGAVLAVIGVGGCPGAPLASFSSVSRGGITLTRLSHDVPMGPRVQARAGDYLLESERVRVVIGGDRVLDTELAGAVIDASPGAWRDDRLGALSPVIEIDGRLVTPRLVAQRPVVGGEWPRLLLTHEAEALSLQTEVSLQPGQSSLRLQTRIENRGTRRVRVRVGDRVRGHGSAPFAPGFGSIDAEREAVLPWFALPGKSASYALVFPARPATVRFLAGPHGPEGQVALGPELDLAPRSSASHERCLVVTQGALESAALEAWQLAGVALGWVNARFEHRPAWSRIEARDELGREILAVEAGLDGTRFALPLGRYRLIHLSPGGKDEQSVEVVSERDAPVRFLPPRAARLAVHVTDDAGRPLAARLVLRGLDGTLNPNLGPSYEAKGASNVAYTESGDASLELPPGRYAVLAAHGPEFDMSEQMVDIDSEHGATVRAQLARVVDTSGWVAADFHLHAAPSPDSKVSLHDRVVALLAEGIEVCAATDHNHVTDYGPTLRELGATGDIHATSGIELTTGSWGHFNVYPYPVGGALPPVDDATPAELFVFARTASPGAVVQVNHPRMSQIGYFNRAELALDPFHAKAGFSWDFDTLEVWNGFDLAKLSVLDDNMLEWMNLLAHGRRFTAVGNSDSHGIAYQWAGYPRTYVKVDDDRPRAVTWASITHALRAGHAIVTSGPFIDVRAGSAGPGDMARAEGGRLGVELEVRAPPWIGIEHADFLLDGKPALHVLASGAERATKSSRGVRLRFRGTLPIAADGFVVVVVRGTTTLDRTLPGTTVVPVAFTNPIFVDGDGDGRWSPPLAALPAR